LLSQVDAQYNSSANALNPLLSRHTTFKNTTATNGFGRSTFFTMLFMVTGHFAYETFRLLDTSPTTWTFRLHDISPPIKLLDRRNL